MDHNTLKEEFSVLSLGGGKIINVRVEGKHLEEDEARTLGVIESVANRHRVELRLIVESGVWKIDSFTRL